MRDVHCAAQTSVCLMVDEVMSSPMSWGNNTRKWRRHCLVEGPLFPCSSPGAIESEALWAMFVAKHNIPFLTSDHGNKLFPKIFADSELVKQFSCGRTKIVK